MISVCTLIPPGLLGLLTGSNSKSNPCVETIFLGVFVLGILLRGVLLLVFSSVSPPCSLVDMREKGCSLSSCVFVIRSLPFLYFDVQERFLKAMFRSFAGALLGALLRSTEPVRTRLRRGRREGRHATMDQYLTLGQ